MIHPIIPYSIKEAIWYQGESNAGRAYQYRRLFKTMITDWRNEWGQGFPFFFEQLANYLERNDMPVENTWAELREAQTIALVYDQDIPYSGPMYTGMEIRGNVAELSFEHVYDGLGTADGGQLKGFSICGKGGSLSGQMLLLTVIRCW